MIKRILLLRNIGKFDSVDTGKDIGLERLTLIYADNGRGKTTLAAVLRSLADGNPDPINERKRANSTHDPHVVIEPNDTSSTLVFKDGSWSGTLTSLAVFDDSFVERNVHSGLSVSPQQRQNLHDIVLGPEAVVLSKQLDELVAKIETHNQQLHTKADAIPAWARGEFSVEDFCALPAIPYIDKAIQDAELHLSATQKQDSIGSAHGFDLLSLPSLDMDEIEKVLQMDLESLQTAALEQLQKHFRELGQGGEKWVSEGMQRIIELDGSASGAQCPFCAQSLQGSLLIEHYQAYFSEAYDKLKRTVGDTLDNVNGWHNENARIEFERKARVVSERQQFWIDFCRFERISLETSDMFQDWRAAWQAIVGLLNAKHAAPLEKMQASGDVQALVAAYRDRVNEVRELNEKLQEANTVIEQVRGQTAQTNVQETLEELNRLKATKARHLPEVAATCADYLQELESKAEAERERDRVRQDLNSHRQISFPQYQEKVNSYLENFGAGFRLELRHENIRRGSTSAYRAQIGNTSIEAVRANPGPGEPSFGSVFSAGDRSTLAFVFFLASLDQNPDLGNTIIVIDDPVSSMDANRSLTTAQKIRELASSAAQVILLSHNKPFLCKVLEHSNVESAALEIARTQEGSTLRRWNVSEDALSEHDKRHKTLQEFYDNNIGEQHEVSRAIRPHLEGFLRVVFPQDFPYGSSLGGQFINKCRQRLNGDRQILTEAKIQELSEILEYASRFQHDTNPQWAPEQLSESELHTFVKRTLEFTRP